MRYDRAGDQHYDVASALIKSMRGSDVDAALHYLARMLEAGEDPRFIARRIVIAASEDVGMADPTALQTAVAAMHAVAQIGMPEARIILAQAVVHNALAPKSNAAYPGINEAIADIRAGQGRPRAAAPARQRVRRRRAARARRGLRLRPRRARRGRARSSTSRTTCTARPTTTGRPTAASRSGSRPRWEWLRELGSAVGNDLSHKGPGCWNPTRDVWHIYAVSWRERHISAPGGTSSGRMRPGSWQPRAGRTPSGRRAHVARFRQPGTAVATEGDLLEPPGPGGGDSGTAVRPSRSPATDCARTRSPSSASRSCCSSSWWRSSRRCSCTLEAPDPLTGAKADRHRTLSSSTSTAADDRRRPPTHWLGVEPRLGRDLFARWAYGARPSLIIGFVAAALSTIIGVTLGLIAGYLGGVADKVISWVIDFFL